MQNTREPAKAKHIQKEKEKINALVCVFVCVC